MSSDNVDMPALEGEVLPGTEDVKPELPGDALKEAFEAIEQNLGYGPDQSVPDVDPHSETGGASFASDNDVFELSSEEKTLFELLEITPEEKELLERIISRAEGVGRDTKLNPSAFQSANFDSGLWIKCAEAYLKNMFEGKSPVTFREGVTLPPHTGWYERLLAN